MFVGACWCLMEVLVGGHSTARELQTCTFERPGLQKHYQNSTRKPPEREERMKFPVGERKKSAKFWALHPSGPHPSGPPPLRAPPKTKLAKCGLAKFGQQKLAKFGQRRMAKCGQLTLAKCGIGQIRFGQMRPNNDGQIRFGQMRSRPRCLVFDADP